MATIYTSAGPMSGLLAMPGEVRNTIYRMLLTNQYAYQHESLACAPLHPAILQVNRQIHEEAINILHGENIWIIAEIADFDAYHWQSIQHRVRKVHREEAAQIKYPALHISFATSVTAEAPQSHVAVIMREENIDDFLFALWGMSINEDSAELFEASSLSLTLCDTPFHERVKLQSTCLKPFSLIHGLRNLSIRGQVEPACVKEILHRAQSGFKIVSQIQSISQAYVEQGDEAYLAGDPMRALASYAYGTEFVTHVMLPKWNEPVPTPEIITLVETIGEINCRSARATTALGDYESVKRGKDMLHARFLPDQALVALKLCIARTHRTLGERADESRLFEEALKAHDDKSSFLTALAELFPEAAHEQARLLVEQQAKIQRGEAIDLDIIRAFWEAV